MEDEAPEDHVDARIRQRQVLGRRGDELRLGAWGKAFDPCSSHVHHPARQIDADHGSPRPGQGNGQVPRAAAEVEHSFAADIAGSGDHGGVEPAQLRRRHRLRSQVGGQEIVKLALAVEASVAVKDGHRYRYNESDRSSLADKRLVVVAAFLPRKMPGLPNFIVLGAAKCGTTSFAHYLNQHPEIQVSDPKEIDYFGAADAKDRVAWYRTHFDESVPRRGEASVSYTMFPEVCEVAPTQMKELIPDAKLIYLVGDPLERAISQWIMWHTKEQDRGFERSRDAGKPIAEVVDDSPLNPYVFPSRYASRLEQYRTEFPDDQILVLDQEQLRSDPQGLLAEAFAFLDVDASFVSPEFSRHLNTSSEWRRARPGYARVRRAVLAAGAERVPASVRAVVGRPLRRRFSPPLDRPVASEVFSDELRELLRGEADELRRMTGLGFEKWSV